MTVVIIKLVATALLVGSIFVILGLLIDNLLLRAGIAPRKKTVPNIITAFFLAFGKVFVFTEISWFVITMAFVLGAVFYSHRGDIWSTKDHGRWWWESEDGSSAPS